MVVERKYEGMFVMSASKAREDWDRIQKDLRGILERQGVSIEKMEKWAERRLCYEIKKQSKGVYVLVHFSAKPEVIREVEHDCQLSENVLRLLILQDVPVPAKADLLAEAGEKGHGNSQ